MDDADADLLVADLAHHAVDPDVDAQHVGTAERALGSRFVARQPHSVGIRLNSSAAHDFVVRAPIVASEENTFDYAMRNYSVEYFAARCRYGACHCCRRITGWRDLPTRSKADYHGFVAPHLIEIDHRARTALASRQNGARSGRRMTTNMNGRAFELP